MLFDDIVKQQLLAWETSRSRRVANQHANREANFSEEVREEYHPYVSDIMLEWGEWTGPPILQTLFIEKTKRKWCVLVYHSITLFNK